MKKQPEKIAGVYEPDEFDRMVSRVGKKAQSGEMKTVWDAKTQRYKVIPASEVTEPVKEAGLDPSAKSALQQFKNKLKQDSTAEPQQQYDDEELQSWKSDVEKNLSPKFIRGREETPTIFDKMRQAAEKENTPIEFKYPKLKDAANAALSAANKFKELENRLQKAESLGILTNAMKSGADITDLFKYAKRTNDFGPLNDKLDKELQTLGDRISQHRIAYSKKRVTSSVSNNGNTLDENDINVSENYSKLKEKISVAFKKLDEKGQRCEEYARIKPQLANMMQEDPDGEFDAAFDEALYEYQKMSEATTSTAKVTAATDKAVTLTDPSTGVKTEIDKTNPNAPSLVQDETGKLKLQKPMATGGSVEPKPNLMGKDVTVTSENYEVLRFRKLAGLK